MWKVGLVAVGSGGLQLGQEESVWQQRLGSSTGGGGQSPPVEAAPPLLSRVSTQEQTCKKKTGEGISE